MIQPRFLRIILPDSLPHFRMSWSQYESHIFSRNSWKMWCIQICLFDWVSYVSLLIQKLAWNPHRNPIESTTSPHPNTIPPVPILLSWYIPHIKQNASKYPQHFDPAPKIPMLLRKSQQKPPSFANPILSTLSTKKLYKPNK